jgi:hypothetical protein
VPFFPPELEASFEINMTVSALGTLGQDSILVNPSNYRAGYPLPQEESVIMPPVGLAALPTELVVKVMKEMSARDLSVFIFSNKRLFAIFKADQTGIMAAVLKKQPEFEILLYLYTLKDTEFRPGGMLHPRTIEFDPELESGRKITFLRAMVNFLEGRLIVPEKIVLFVEDIIELWMLVQVIDYWTEQYPSLRWRDHPEDRRCLKPVEEIRLRKAVARWWLYAKYFHGVFWRDTSCPRKWRVDDRRLHHLRILSTVEIRELEDLWGVMFDTISRDLCSSIEEVGHGVGIPACSSTWNGIMLTTSQRNSCVELVPWGKDEGRHHAIVNTYLKLDPEQLKYFLQLYRHHRRKKVDVIRTVSMSMRTFHLDRESLSLSINTVLEERMMLKPAGINRLPRSGIVDEDRDKGLSVLWSTDSSPSGHPPLSKEQIGAFPIEYDKRVHYGDDGSDGPY